VSPELARFLVAAAAAPNREAFAPERTTVSLRWLLEVEHTRGATLPWDVIALSTLCIPIVRDHVGFWLDALMSPRESCQEESRSLPRGWIGIASFGWVPDETRTIDTMVGVASRPERREVRTRPDRRGARRRQGARRIRGRRGAGVAAAIPHRRVTLGQPRNAALQSSPGNNVSPGAPSQSTKRRSSVTVHPAGPGHCSKVCQTPPRHSSEALPSTLQLAVPSPSFPQGSPGVARRSSQSTKRSLATHPVGPPHAIARH
jgi:hypothetical protein